MKTSDLIGPALDWAVAKSEGSIGKWYCTRYGKTERVTNWHPSTNWSQGGTIIERERITVAPADGESFVGQEAWCAYRIETLFKEAHDHEYQYGPTPLITAMRCYVASKLGDEVEMPKELL